MQIFGVRVALIHIPTWSLKRLLFKTVNECFSLICLIFSSPTGSALNSICSENKRANAIGIFWLAGWEESGLRKVPRCVMALHTSAWHAVCSRPRMKQAGLSEAGGAGVKGEEMEQVPELRGSNPHPNATVCKNTELMKSKHAKLQE